MVYRSVACWCKAFGLTQRRTQVKKILISTVGSVAFLLAACTSAEVQANILAGCQALGAGASAVAVVAGALPDGAIVNTVITGIIGSVINDCPTFATDVAAAVSAISNIGGSGTVAVSAQTASMKLRGERAKSSVPFHFGPYGS
jgi:hypothetical protein